MILSCLPMFVACPFVLVGWGGIMARFLSWSANGIYVVGTMVRYLFGCLHPLSLGWNQGHLIRTCPHSFHFIRHTFVHSPMYPIDHEGVGKLSSFCKFSRFSSCGKDRSINISAILKVEQSAGTAAHGRVCLRNIRHHDVLLLRNEHCKLLRRLRVSGRTICKIDF